MCRLVLPARLEFHSSTLANNIPHYIIPQYRVTRGVIRTTAINNVSICHFEKVYPVSSSPIEGMHNIWILSPHTDRLNNPLQCGYTLPSLEMCHNLWGDHAKGWAFQQLSSIDSQPHNTVRPHACSISASNKYKGIGVATNAKTLTSANTSEDDQV